MAINPMIYKKKSPFEIKNDEDFNQLAIEVFNFQHQHVPVYRNYCELLKIEASKILSVEQIPFLPISAFKHHKVLVEGQNERIIFKSSGTTSANRSSHFVSDPSIYEQSLGLAFNSLIGNPEEYLFFSLLPGYEENKESSLIYMLNTLSKQSKDGSIHRFPNDNNKLLHALLEANAQGQKSILIGVSFALLDLAEIADISLPFTRILETGGMKGTRKEIIRSELHEIIREKLKPGDIISEYGMTEMLSQAYSINSEWFSSPKWLKVLLRDVHDPLNVKTSGSGILNVIDLANVNSCSFIATDDLGSLRDDGSFAVLGRFDHSDIRGCNLLYNN